MKKKDYLILIILASIPFVLIFIMMPKEAIFGHNVDWISQHTVIPDYFRSLFYENANLFSDFAPHLGGGANIYAFSYYGLFRPDVLFGYLLPNVNMATIIMVYMIVMISLGACLNYVWLRTKSYPSSICAFVSFLLICSSFFFHAHKQIMFVNYIPYLIMSFMSIDYYLKKHKSTWMIISILLIILHSYFFSVAAIIICCIYYVYASNHMKRMKLCDLKKKQTIKFAYSILIAIMIAAILLVPTALVILENAKNVATTTTTEILSLSPDLKGLLYDRYGCGLTMIAWACLILGLQSRKTRPLSIILIVSFMFPIVSYILNGTLYARTKILIVFLPLVLLIIAEVLKQIQHKQIKMKLYILPALLLPTLFYQGQKEFILIDVMTVVLLLALYAYKQKAQTFLIMAIVPLFLLIQTNSPEQFVDKKTFAKTIDKDKRQLIDEYSDQLVGRTDDFTAPLTNANRVYSLNDYKTTSYTSTNNSRYNNFYYDILKNPISIANRVANLANANIFFQGMMGVHTLYTNTKIPIGYEVVDQNKEITIVKNDNVLPLAYATSQLISEQKFDALTYPYTLDTIYNNAVVENGKTDYQSQMKEIKLEYTIQSQSKYLSLHKNEHSIKVKAKKDAKLKLDLHDDFNDQILLISFDIKNVEKAEKRETAITINGIKNKLSRGNAPYPNNNTHFTYIVSSNEALKNLNITFSKGSYSLDNIQIHSLNYDVIKNRAKQVTPLVHEETRGKEIMKGKITTAKDSYFITSLPYQQGYRVYVDGKDIQTEIVNKAFLGFPLASGEHSITIEFYAPGKGLGMYLSTFGCILFTLNDIMEKRKNDEQKSN